jgi:hypothetical protein
LIEKLTFFEQVFSKVVKFASCFLKVFTTASETEVEST